MPLYAIETAGQLDPHLQQEWLLTNGMGGYSSSTVVGCNTRRYHGLLVGATVPPVGRLLALHRVAEVIELASAGQKTTHELSVNQFPRSFHPHGEQYLRRFELGHAARWEYVIDGMPLVKELILGVRRNAIAIRYTITPEPGQKVTLKLLPFISLRDFHGIQRRHDGLLEVKESVSGVVVNRQDQSLWMHLDQGAFTQGADWWYDHFYAVDAERGQEAVEDQFCPGHWIFETDQPCALTFWAGMGKPETFDFDTEHAARVSAETQGMAAGGPDFIAHPSPTMQKLIRAANDFVVDRKLPDGTTGSTVLAGYPWFADWGRDTMISLPGLLLTTRRFAQAKQVLSVFAHYVSEGMIPNRFDDYSNEPSYNTVDASLWFVHACFEYLKASGDRETFDRDLRPACQAVIEGYEHGTRFHIAMDPADGLITQGDSNTQLTWMDAKCEGIAFTPRQGKAVEINALWYHALVLMGRTELAERVKQSFHLSFWISPFRGLADVVEGSRKDQSIRPNQIFAVSLPNSPLTSEQQQAVVEVVRRELLTPVGLRSLSPTDGRYHRFYTGGQRHRDEAYHNGTIWGWLIGPYLSAYLRVNGGSDLSKAQVRRWLEPLVARMDENGCIGQIAEIFEAEPPHRPVGCFAQAWSVAEVLRVAAELEM